jgi:hypothetical protein
VPEKKSPAFYYFEIMIWPGVEVADEDEIRLT